MPTGPTVSVVMPTYNRAVLIGQALQAILAQTRPADEVIVVDDGSTDATAEILARLAPRVRHIRIDNSGDLAARNVGMRAATGDLVAFCDSDDVWRPGFLAAAAAAWALEPRLIAAFADFVVIRDGVWQEATKFAQAPAGFWAGLRKLAPHLAVFDAPPVERLIGFQPFFPSCLVADRDFFLRIGGWNESASTRGTDFATALLLAEHVPFGVLQQPHVGIRKHPGNFSGNALATNLSDAAVLEHLLGCRPSLARYGDAIRASITSRRAAALQAAFAQRDLARVREIAGLLQLSGCSGRVRAKALIAALPDPLGRRLARLLLRRG